MERTSFSICYHGLYEYFLMATVLEIGTVTFLLMQSRLGSKNVETLVPHLDDILVFPLRSNLCLAGSNVISKTTGLYSEIQILANS